MRAEYNIRDLNPSENPYIDASKENFEKSIMTDKEFSQRICDLRKEKNVSGREMSIALGQNPGYIHAIESGKAYPGMGNFFDICDYFGITPEQFFHLDTKYPEKVNQLTDIASHLSSAQLDLLISVAGEFENANRNGQPDS